MTSSTFSVAEAEARGTFVNGFLWDMEDITKGKKRNAGSCRPVLPTPREKKELGLVREVFSRLRATW